MRHETLWFWTLVTPALAGFLILTAGPMLASLYLSFTKYDAVSPPQFIGLRNYLFLFQFEPTFWISLKVTLLYALMYVPLNLCSALLAALLLDLRVRAIGFYRTVYFLPAILPATASAIIWIWIFNPKYGILNRMLAAAGIEGPAWLNSTTWALPALVIMAAWSFGGTMLIFLAGLQGIPRALYESAEIDGAGAFRRFTGLAGPGVVGGPARATLFYVLNLYDTAFTYFHMGLASAMAWFLFFLILVLTLLNFSLKHLWVFQDKA
ncbi:MAG: sugar ABC transporter permease [Candidatus Sumerlaeota bacterium]|nr:sugar ABC transporter permease [Candidatus Sumerlaeota bacterium]